MSTTSSAELSETGFVTPSPTFQQGIEVNQTLKDGLNNPPRSMMILFMVRQAHHECKQQFSVRPELVEGLKQKTPQAGFTLLEILVAMAVFAIMAGMAYSGLHTVLATRNSTEARAETLAQWQRFVYILNEDLMQALPRGVRDELGSTQLAFSGGNDNNLLSLTRGVADWSGQSQRSRLQRVEYRLEADGVYRQVWPVLDRNQQSQPRRRKVLPTAVIALRFYAGEWDTVWPASGGGLPKAVEASVQLPELGNLRRVFTVRP